VNWLNRAFKLDEHKVSARGEVLAGLTTFAAMAYILAVNPAILAAAGMERGGVVVATALAAALGCFIMAWLTNFPIALAPGMGTNAYFAFVICIGMQVPWEAALAMTFWNGVIFLLLSASGFRRHLAESLPEGVKVGIQCGIGLFIAFIGLKNVGIIIQDDATFVSIGNVTDPGPLLVMAGVVVMLYLSIKKVPGAILIPIAGISLIGLIIPNGEGSFLTRLPDTFFGLPSDYESTFGKLDILYPILQWKEALPVVLTLLVLDLFDSIGTLVGLSHRANLIDKNGKMPGMGKALTADAIATMGGAVLGTSTTTSYVESAAGIEAGGRTGLTSVVVGLCFLGSLLMVPLIASIPAIATAPALVMVGILMSQGLQRLPYDDLAETASAVLTMLLIPLTFSITEGIGVGLLVYVALKALLREWKKVSPVTWIVASLFVVYYAFL
jgi:AGZA family xanthine/uracil permease-like MFS transporter